MDVNTNAFARTDLRLPPADPLGTLLVLREVTRAAATPSRPVLLLHGATLPGTALFDAPPPGLSWLEDLAASGRAAYALDLRGHGLSGAVPLHAARAYARAAEVAADVTAAARTILARTGAESLDLLGGSWGSIVAGVVAASGVLPIRRLVLYAPIFAAPNRPWLDWIEDPAAKGTLHPSLGPARPVTATEIRARWDGELRAAGQPDLLDDAVFGALMRAFIPAGAGHATVPNGALADLLDAFTGRPLYDPAAITAPTLLIRGADDPTSTLDDAADLLARLGSAEKRLVVIGRGTHFVSAERHAPQVFAETRLFLD